VFVISRRCTSASSLTDSQVLTGQSRSILLQTMRMSLLCPPLPCEVLQSIRPWCSACRGLPCLGRVPGDFHFSGLQWGGNLLILNTFHPELSENRKYTWCKTEGKTGQDSPHLEPLEPCTCKLSPGGSEAISFLTVKFSLLVCSDGS
jgi:hypothetical protein